MNGVLEHEPKGHYRPSREGGLGRIPVSVSKGTDPSDFGRPDTLEIGPRGSRNRGCPAARPDAYLRQPGCYAWHPPCRSWPQILGHRNVTMSLRYALADDRQVVAAAKRIGSTISGWLGLASVSAPDGAWDSCSGANASQALMWVSKDDPGIGKDVKLWHKQCDTGYTLRAARFLPTIRFLIQS